MNMLEERFSSLQYQFDHRKRELETHEGRHLDWIIPNQEERIAKAQKDDFYFLKEYFPEHHFNIDFAWFHKVISWCMNDDKGLFHLFCGARGHGKTRVVRALAMKLAVFGQWNFISWTGDDLALSKGSLGLIKLEFASNPKIIADYGRLLDPNRRADDDFRILPSDHNKHGTVFKAFSMRSTPRGQLEDFRIQLDIYEDVEDFGSSINPDQTIKKLDTIKRDFLPARDGNRSTSVFLTNNPQETCIANTLKKMEEKELREFMPNARLYFIPAWNDGSNTIINGHVTGKHPVGPTWPEKDGRHESEEAMRVDQGYDITTWQTEKQNNPQPPQGDTFHKQHWVDYDQLPQDAEGLIWVDPAHGKTSSYKAAAVILYSPSTRKFYTLMPFCRKSDWGELFQHLHQVLFVLSGRIFAIYWENYFGQDSYIEFQQISEYTKNLPPLPIIPDAIPGSKTFRIMRTLAPWQGDQFRFDPDFARTDDGARAKNIHLAYKKGQEKRVDWTDAFACGYAKLFEMRFGLITSEEGSDNKSFHTFKKNIKRLY